MEVCGPDENPLIEEAQARGLKVARIGPVAEMDLSTRTGFY